MSVRPIEVQGSFPHSQEVGKLQEQLQQRGQMSQTIMAEQQKHEDQLKRKQVNKSGESEKARLQSETFEKRTKHHGKQDDGQKEKEEQRENHPYKGKFIDFSS
ncbi:hypothetical protein GN156_00920 [bacterium LRH843]|nr:hypothetical protein [bacterium LRH843]